jgi:xanthine dehydrogenase YagS FAD-binding subunit
VPYKYNSFKIALGQDTLVRVLNELVHPGAGSSAPGTSAGELP